MEFDFTWVLLGFPIAFTLGWLASRLDLRQLRIENRQAPKAYFKGLNFLLNEQQDQAIDAFIEAVQNDPDTSELHFALGNLFRRRGEYERAVRVHEHLMSRGDLTQPERDRAQHALALDFLKAGLLDRAEIALRKLEGTPFEEEARLALLSIYERSRDWANATEIAARLGSSSHGSFSTRQAHYLCEQAGTAAAAGDTAQALANLQAAALMAPASARPLIDLAKLQHQLGRPQDAMQSLLKLEEIAPQGLPLAAGLLANIAHSSGQQQAALEHLKASYAHMPSIDVVEAIVKLEQDPLAARQWYLQHLEHQTSLVAAGKWIAGEPLGNAQQHALVQRTLDQATKPLMRYRCAACGFEATQHFWHCPGCQAWDSYPTRRIEEL
ncbi:Lipopolysaccharide biosynthesis regulator YciM, contains six TPR domains and a predicted metal-binding C-terminal domain [Polaromonas sp. OV174]|uniref:lipopolysaccharide assembly protein LapB n=1 Tax=Polaromonas sp. OV174 TaxID=1855300 RepID=UPI0008E5EC42|nr:lipopolysaccharide assembly protein LapB [Polaromonas sp. OV174]SFB75143.1 Lipopolysaccharide biosynthesis regulator YciM, contains six TPR domains and a predicted metal-binding C-terminal domain [Polaromonas sp. OV174]